MLDLQNILLTVDFEFGRAHKNYLNVDAQYNNQTFRVFPYTQNDVELGQLLLPVCLPAQVQLHFSGKTDQDVEVDPVTHAIVRDTYVKIKQIRLDGFPLNDNFLNKNIIQRTEEHGDVASSYVGFNCTVLLDFRETDVFSQVLFLNN